jgi:hypothetical protein
LEKNVNSPDNTSTARFSANKSVSKKRRFAGISTGFWFVEAERTAQKTKWRANSLSNRSYPFGEKDQGRRGEESDNALADLSFFSSSVSKFGFAKLPRESHFSCYILPYLIDNKGDGGRGGIRTPDTLSGTPVFKTGAINHSATLPL